MIEVTILVPVRDNEGKAFTSEDFEVFETYVVDVVGGFTVLPYNSVGGWAEAGVVYRDDARLYIIAVESIIVGDRIARVVAMAKVLFRQKAIYIRYLGIAEVH